MFRYFLLGLIAGLALGVAIAILFDLSSTSEKDWNLPESLEITYQNEELKDSLDKLSRAVSDLTQTMKRSPSTARIQEGLAREQEGSVQAELIEKLEAAKGPADWAKVLNSSLASALLENAKTPYDPGVSPLLAEAAKKLRNAKSQYYKDLKENSLLRERSREDEQY